MFNLFKKKPPEASAPPQITPPTPPEPKQQRDKKPKKSSKEIATEKGEPYISIVSVDLDPNDVGNGSFELDWNSFFVAKLIRSGYKGKDDQQIVDQWFQDVCRNVVLETFEQFEANNPRPSTGVQKKILGMDVAKFSNFWTPNTIPYSWNPKSQSTMWSGTDKLENFMKNPEKDKWVYSDIYYKFNKHGFRTYEFDNLYGKTVDIALGCSFTQGVGLSEKNIWPYFVEQQRPYPLLNLGLGGGATDTVARILTNIYKMFNIDTVFVQWPLYSRFEIYSENEIQTILPASAEVEHTWNMTDSVAVQRFFKNQSIVKSFEYRIVEMSPLEFLDEPGIWVDSARDGIHPGVETHKNLAKKFLDQLTNS